MSSLPFTIEVDRSTGVIRATAYEFWTLATLAQYEAAVVAAQGAVRRSGLGPLLLIDVRRHGVQSREVVQGLQRFAGSTHGRTMKTALIVESALYRLQAARIGSSAHHAMFQNDDDALAWLLEREGDVPGAPFPPAI